MHRILSLFITLLLFVSFSLTAQSLKDLSLGNDADFEMMTWNIEWFPKAGQTTADSVELIIKSLNPDVIALQEISDTNLFKSVLNNIGGYSSYFKWSNYQGLGFAYKTDSVQILDLYEIYTGSAYLSPFPRAPQVMELMFRGEKFVIINNHYKCCGNGTMDPTDPGDEEMRRLLANQLLKQYIDTNFAGDNVILTGDLNDILTDNLANNVFQEFIDDTLNYLFTDMVIATGLSTGWSYPSWPSHLDHILITNDMFDKFNHDSSFVQVIKIDEYMNGGWSTYDNYVSDHRPVALKIYFGQSNNSIPEQKGHSELLIYPNPTSGEAVVKHSPAQTGDFIELFSIEGRLVYRHELDAGDTSTMITTEDLQSGIYLLSLNSSGAYNSIGRLQIID